VKEPGCIDQEMSTVQWTTENLGGNSKEIDATKYNAIVSTNILFYIFISI
jgi:hypothetical protein